jgi:hypothetical protein
MLLELPKRLVKIAHIRIFFFVQLGSLLESLISIFVCVLIKHEY